MIELVGGTITVAGVVLINRRRSGVPRDRRDVPLRTAVAGR
ncbi:hypothetical protein ACFYPZ_25160 [Streptomyces sp. NPDC005506]